MERHRRSRPPVDRSRVHGQGCPAHPVRFTISRARASGWRNHLKKEASMKYDLLLTGGEVVDPAAGLRGVMDIGIAGGKIVAVGPSLAASEARRTIAAKGRLVAPGLVDIHAHMFVNAHDMAGDTDRFCRASGVTTLCDA